MLRHPIYIPKPNKMMATMIKRARKYFLDVNFFRRKRRAIPSKKKKIPTITPKAISLILPGLDVLVP